MSGDESKNEDRVILVYTTLSSARDAETLGEKLIERGLASCVNIIPGVQSIYELDGHMEYDHEAVMIIKTRFALKTRLLEEGSRLHPYETPALIVLESNDCNEDFLKWTRLQTSQKGRGVN